MYKVRIRKIRFVAWICIFSMLNLMAANCIYAITNPAYIGTTILGPSTVAIVSGGASGIKVNTLLGNLCLPISDLTIPARGIPIKVERTYNSSQHGQTGPFGYGWQFSYSMNYIRSADGKVIVFWGDGRIDVFEPSGGTYVPLNEGVFATLDQYQPNQFRVTTQEGIQYYFDNPSHGHVTRIADPNSNSLLFAYNASQQLTTITDESGRQLSLSYTLGKVTTFTDPNTSPARTLQYAYDANGNQVGFIDSLGNVTHYDYDATHRLTKITDALGITNIDYSAAAPASTVGTIKRSTPTNTLLSQRSFLFNSATNTMSVRDMIDSTHTALTSYHYDSNDRLTSITDPIGHTATRTYDADGNLVSATDANGNTTHYTYDTRGNMLSQTDALGNTTTFTYENTFNRITSVTDPDSHTTTFGYDGNGNRTFMQDALGNTTQYTYDGFGQLVSRRNPLGFTTNFTYDAQGDRTSITDPLNHTTHFDYDQVGNLIHRTDGLNRTIVNSYDARNRLRQVSFPDATQSTFTYDPAGNVLSAVDPNTNLTYAYDAENRLLQASDNLLSKTISYQYNGVGNRVSMTDPEGVKALYGYDLASRLIQVDRAGQQFLFEYDNGNRRTRLTLPNGSFTIYTYDNADRLLSQANMRSDNTILSSFTYQYDVVGNRVGLSLAGGEHISYGYDGHNQLIQEVRTGGASNYDHRFAYDADGNRTQANADGVITSYNYDNGDRLTQETTGATTTTYAYDPDGNQIQKAVGASLYTSTYDVRDRLIQFSSPTTTAMYTYDALDKRIIKSVGAATIRTVYDGLNAVAEYDGSGTLQAQNLFGPGVDENLARFTSSESLYYLYDGQRSVQCLVDAAQTVRNSYDYDAWGKIVSQVETAGNDYTFTGRQTDRESGLYYYRARMYDPSIGRFTQIDPRDDNSAKSLYIYTDNHSVGAGDPLGEDFWSTLGDLFNRFLNWLDRHIPSHLNWRTHTTVKASGTIGIISFSAEVDSQIYIGTDPETNNSPGNGKQPGGPTPPPPVPQGDGANKPRTHSK
ncbi:MAG TPA: RHS repeat-associated core domain-containing protein [Chthonomonadaceae bacterium]|nr:RHS repeat-associated core domain-containing protein [Chthonomonadaceae bacterium]